MASKGNTQEANQSSIGQTKEELLAEIERLKTVVRDQQDQISQQAAVVKTGTTGWMISTPNQTYTGHTAGVYFENGHAFIPVDLKNAKKLVAILTNDFGYSATETNDGQAVKAPPEKKGQSVFEAAMQPHVMN